MFWRRTVLFLVAAAFACAGAGPSRADAPRMTKEELKPLLGKAEVVVIDVRAGGDWDGSGEKIAGAVREEPGQEQAWAGKYGKDKTLVFYCA